MKNIKNLNIDNLCSKELRTIQGGNELTDTIWRAIGYWTAKWGQGNVAYMRGTQGDYGSY